MAYAASDGRVTVWSVPSIANTAAPTAAEIAAGTNITAALTPDGLVGFQPDTADVAVATLADDFDAVVPGRVSMSGMALTFLWNSSTDTNFNTFVKNYTTNIVIRRKIAFATAVSSGQGLIVVPVVCGETAPQDAAPNELDKFQVPLKPAGKPNFHAAVA